MAKHYRGRLYEARSQRYHSLTGTLPGELTNNAGNKLPFYKVLDVAAHGIGLEINKYLAEGTELNLTVEDCTCQMEVVYCVSIPKEEIYRCGLKLVSGANENLVELFRNNGCNYLVPIDSDQYEQLLFKKSS